MPMCFRENPAQQKRSRAQPISNSTQQLNFTDQSIKPDVANRSKRSFSNDARIILHGTTQAQDRKEAVKREMEQSELFATSSFAGIRKEKY